MPFENAFGLLLCGPFHILPFWPFQPAPYIPWPGLKFMPTFIPFMLFKPFIPAMPMFGPPKPPNIPCIIGVVIAMLGMPKTSDQSFFHYRDRLQDNEPIMLLRFPIPFADMYCIIEL